ncbi:MAG: periplasmic protein CpxP/Spy [Gemmatimonadaceae bacterium]|jgi:Spy/CpxP family protein refolding chaperone|nr:periplasmic protein CpxP/Spy [Gemmatimonadaceae bacterium]
MRRRLALTALSLLLAATAANAQPVTAPANPNRAALEQRFREQSAKVAQQRLGLSDAQLAQLVQSNARFAPQQNQLVVQERETRRQLRVEMTAGNQANQAHVSALLDDAMRLQKQRIALVEAEQKDLARFLTPVQRAGYLSLQAQVRRRAQELARNNGTQGDGFGQRQGLGLRRPAGKRLP